MKQNTTKKSICLNFQVHEPLKLRLYRFFDIGIDSHYYDDFACRTAVKRAAQECYLPTNAMLLELIKASKGGFKASFTISGSAMEQFERYAPDVIDSFKALADTGCVEFLATPYYHSLSSLVSGAEFKHQVLKHMDLMKSVLGVTPEAFCNAELIYSDAIGSEIAGMGFKTVLTEGAKNILGWRSPDYVYSSENVEGLKLLMRSYSLSDDIGIRFSRRDWASWPLTAEKYIDWLSATDGDVVNLCIGYDSFGLVHPAESGIFEFFKAMVLQAPMDGMCFATPSEVVAAYKPAAELSVPEPISWTGVESDVSAWLGNELQQDAFNKLYALTEKLSILGDADLWADFGHLQESDNFYYMCTKFFAEGDARKFYNPYDTPYEAFINYMNVLNDFTIRVNDKMAER